MKSADLLSAGWKDITGSFDERERYLELQRQGKAVVRRLHNGWFAKDIPVAQEQYITGTLSNDNVVESDADPGL
jgi:hypothetical protein